MSSSSSDLDTPPQPGAMQPGEAADYIGEVSSELATLARRCRLDLLAYLLEMVRLEAGHCATKGEKDQL